MADPRFPAKNRASPGSRGGEPAPAPILSRRIFGQLVFFTLLLLSIGIGALGGMIFVYSSDLPQVRQLEDYRPNVMTELYADDGTVIGSFALERRVIITYSQVPQVLEDAVLSIEDRHFESHWGVDVVRILRAGSTDLLEWRKAQGASTLTQQLSRMFFLTPEKSFRRKLQEILLAIQIERRFTKPQIFTMYSNEVSLGHGTFGFEAAAEFYFGKHLSELTLPEAALLAGLPKTPTAYSPILHPDRALQRRNQVLLAMLDNGKVTKAHYEQARAAPLGLHIQRWDNNTAPYFVEEVRQLLEKKYGPETVHEKGLRVYTALNLRAQRLAEKALIQGLHNDDKRRGWRGPEKNILKDPPRLQGGGVATLETYADPDWRKPFEAGAWVHGVVMQVRPDWALVRLGAFTARVTPADFAWTKKTRPGDVFSPGDLDLFLVKEAKGKTLRVTLDQRPDVQGAVVVIDNATGSVKAMVGGYDFNESKYNRAVQAERQVGSSFKVYVYSQALLEGMSPFNTILDAPVSFPSSSGIWSPHNYDDKFEGPVTLLHALAESRNVPAVRLIARVGVDKVIKLCRKLGITSRLVPNLPLALGASDLTLVEHTSAFTAFPDDGVHVAPHIIEQVTNYDGAVVDAFRPEITDVLPAGVARLMVSMLREAINSGTAVRAKAFAAKYPVAGKTGTTNDFSDAWFIGFSPSLTCGVWVGFDDHRALGPKEEGARVALPIWMDFMSEALKTRPVEDFPQSPLLTNPDQVKEILASAGTQALPAEHGASAGSADSAQRSPAAATAPAPAVAPSHPGAAVTPAVSRRGSIVDSLQGNGPGPIRAPAEPPQLPDFVAPRGAAPPKVKPAAEAPQASDPAPPSLTLPAVTGDGQQRIAPLPDAPPPPAPEKSGVTGALRHAKRGLRRIGEKIIHR